MPVQMSFYARGDSSSANNAALNVENTSQQPVVQLTFVARPGGDIVLERNDGNPDPDTTVIINGVHHNFTVEITGGLPHSSNKIPNALEGKEVTVISAVINGVTERFFFVSDGSGSMNLMNQFGNGAIALTTANFDPAPVHICFVSGTEILTPSGNRKIEDLCQGDFVVTAEGLAKQILWIGHTDISVKEMAGDASLRPIRIRAHSMGPGLPYMDLQLSSQHRIAAQNPLSALLFGESCVMVRAKHLVGHVAEMFLPAHATRFFHLLLDEHDMVVANGMDCESFQPSRRNYDGLSASMKTSFSQHIQAARLDDLCARPDAMSTLKSHEADVLLKWIYGDKAKAGAETTCCDWPLAA